jgi:hypothetical protein
MARQKRKLRRLSLHSLRDCVDKMDARLKKAVNDADQPKKAKVRQLRRALRQIRRTLASNCCDNSWSCEFIDV